MLSKCGFEELERENDWCFLLGLGNELISLFSQARPSLRHHWVPREIGNNSRIPSRDGHCSLSNPWIDCPLGIDFFSGVSLLERWPLPEEQFSLAGDINTEAKAFFLLPKFAKQGPLYSPYNLFLFSKAFLWKSRGRGHIKRLIDTGLNILAISVSPHLWLYLVA